MFSNCFGGEYKKCANLSEACYSFSPETAKVGTAVRDERYTTDKKNGFQGCVYVDGNTVIIAYRGTDQKRDLVSDTQMAAKCVPNQYADALELYNKVAQDPKFKGKEIVLTGHSLGGSLAQLVSSSKMGNGVRPRAITFNAYGVVPIIEKKQNIFDVNKKNDNFYIPEDKYIGAARDHSGNDISINIDDLKKGEKHSIVSFQKASRADFFWASILNKVGLA